MTTKQQTIKASTIRKFLLYINNYSGIDVKDEKLLRQDLFFFVNVVILPNIFC